MREIKSHTALRGIAALLVVIYHYRVALPENLNPDTYTQFFAKGYLWVDCFFILSGFILSYVYGYSVVEDGASLTRFFRARFARIYPLHAMTLICLAIFALILPHISHQTTSLNWYTFLLNLFDVHAWGVLGAYDWNFPSWSISVEFAAYLIYPLASFIFLRSGRLAAVISVGLFIFALNIGREHWERLALLHGIPLFLMGMLVFRIPRVAAVVLPFQIGGIFLLLLTLHLGLSDWLAELSFVALVYSMQWDDGLADCLGNAPLLGLGTLSYSIYMLHIPIREVADRTINAMMPRSLYFFSIIALTLMAAKISYKLFEMPARTLIADRKRIAVAAATANQSYS